MTIENTPKPTLDQLQLDIQEIKGYLLELNELQKLELLEIRKNRLINSKRLDIIGTRIFHLLLLVAVTGGGFFLYKELDPVTKNKVGESIIAQLAPFILAGVSAQQLFANKKERKKLSKEEEEDSEYLIQQYETIKQNSSIKNNL